MIEDAQRLWPRLGSLPEPVAHPVLVALAGLPGTGKSFFSRELAARWPFVILESDALRRVLFTHPTYSPDESIRLFQAIHFMIEMLLKSGLSAILDATNLSEKYREPLYAIAERLGIKLILVWTEAPAAVVYERLHAREEMGQPDGASDADWSVYVKMKPTAQKIRRKHYLVDTAGDVTPAVDRIIRELRK